MEPIRRSRRAFTLLELLMAMALFAIAAVSLARAINLVGLTVTESIEAAEIREQVRSVLLEYSRRPDLREETRETNPNETGISFRIEIEAVFPETREGVSLEEIYEVRVTALRKDGLRGTVPVDTASTWVNPGMF